MAGFFEDLQKRYQTGLNQLANSSPMARTAVQTASPLLNNPLWSAAGQVGQTAVQGIDWAADQANKLMAGGGQNYAPGVNTYQATAPQLDRTNFADALRLGQEQQRIGFGRAEQTANQQGNLANMLFAQANGQGPSLAQMQLQQATDQNLRQSAGAIASQRGLNPAQQARLILQNQASINQGAAGQSGLLRMQEQMQAREMLGNVLNSQQNANLGMAGLGNNYFTSAGGLQNGQNAGLIQNAGMINDVNARVSEGNADRATKITQQQMVTDAEKEKAKMELAAKAAGGVLGGVGGMLGKIGMAYSGAEVPGEAQKKGDHPDNDTVPAMLSPGEIVLPRSVAQAEDAPAAAAKFVESLKKKDAGKSGDGYGRLLIAHRELDERLKRLEMAYGGKVKCD